MTLSESWVNRIRLGQPQQTKVELMNNTKYELTITFGNRYSITGFETEAEARAFAEQYKGNEEGMEHDFMDLPYDAWCRSLDNENNFIEIASYEEPMD